MAVIQYIGCVCGNVISQRFFEWYSQFMKMVLNSLTGLVRAGTSVVVVIIPAQQEQQVCNEQANNKTIILK